jgi:hypothetical protein
MTPMERQYINVVLAWLTTLVALYVFQAYFTG